MTKAKQAILPAYLLLCLLIGGSVQGIWAVAMLQALAVAILAGGRDEPSPTDAACGQALLDVAGRPARIAVCPAIGAVAALAVDDHSRPWVLAEGYRMLGMPLPWLPLSLGA